MTTDPTHDRTRRVEIPEHTAEAIADRLPMTEFDSVDEYVSFALGRLLRELEGEQPIGPLPRQGPEKRHDTAEREGVEDRLESLGYL